MYLMRTRYLTDAYEKCMVSVGGANLPPSSEVRYVALNLCV
jgi:hypothetical protein